MTYELLTEESVPSYLRGVPDLAARVDVDSLDVVEVGDGNLNLVFICTGTDGRSLVLKQSLPYVRVDPTWPLTADRSTAEAIGLRAANAASPAISPELYGYDEPRHVLAMEDLSHLAVWRGVLDGGDIHHGAAEALGRHVARVLFGTGPIGLAAEDFRAAIGPATNTALCRITEDLVFTEPFVDHEHNDHDPRLAPLVNAISGDDVAMAEVGRVKQEFLSRVDGLVHGDLHTGSVMLGTGPDGGLDVRAIDVEFCCYGPVAFDLGMLAGNFAFAWARSTVLERADHAAWSATLPGELWDGFVDEFWSRWPDRVDPAFTDTQAVAWLARIGHDVAGFAACEAVRRIVGFAKVSDIAGLEGDAHVTAASMVLTRAHRWLTGDHDGPASLLG